MLGKQIRRFFQLLHELTEADYRVHQLRIGSVRLYASAVPQQSVTDAIRNYCPAIPACATDNDIHRICLAA